MSTIDIQLYAGDSLLFIKHSWVKDSILINGLDAGAYRMEYSTIFFQKRSIAFTLDQKQQTVEICVDRLTEEDYNDTTLIDQLQNGEHYSIDYESVGWFHAYRDTLIVSKDTLGYHIRFLDEHRLLTATEVENIRRLEIELQYLYGGGCSTQELYILTYNGRSTEYFDSGCQYFGGHHLIEELGFSHKNRRH